MKVGVTRPLQVILVSALSPHILLAATPHVTPILLLVGVALPHWARDSACKLSLPLLLPIIQEHLLIELTQLHYLVHCVSLI
jgi:hypothetical protein